MSIIRRKLILGNIEGPSQYEAEELVGKLIEIKPQEFPPAFPCSISVNGKVFFDYLLMRTKEILEDGTVILDNREVNKEALGFFNRYERCYE
ncbi:hypothetical protein [Butyrivibrio fibrisolvens]|uniref:hypothetical protein n=1 Tax=Butyrivibrio fibrisolvens TaxID=831 RepID=UPI0003B7B5BB|nr:hypothetical protein [Butyrivibrio fibrisolvens]